MDANDEEHFAPWWSDGVRVLQAYKHLAPPEQRQVRQTRQWVAFVVQLTVLP